MFPMSVDPPPESALALSSSTEGQSGWPSAAQFSRNDSHIGPFETMSGHSNSNSSSASSFGQNKSRTAAAAAAKAMSGQSVQQRHGTRAIRSLRRTCVDVSAVLPVVLRRVGQPLHLDLAAGGDSGALEAPFDLLAQHGEIGDVERADVPETVQANSGRG